jgi:ubiquinol-cytochrome c reductase cytochrome c subunit
VRVTGRRWRHGLRTVLVTGFALLATGWLYTALAPAPQAAAQPDDAALVAQGRELFTASCISCHGANLQGVAQRGPSIVGAGDAAVYFQVSSGRMPLAREDPQAYRKPPPPQFDPDTAQGQHNLQALGAYVQAAGAGPERPAVGGRLVGSDPAVGSELFRLNCSSCHNFTGRGGALMDGKYAPNLREATPEQVWTAMLSGPQAMPRFTDRQLTPEDKADIIAYVLSVRGQANAVGGLNLGEVGPTSEGLVVFLVGLAATVAVTAWLGSRS